MTLRETQQRMAAALMTPLKDGERIARRTRTGVSMAREAAEIIKPNDRLTSLERLQIYSRSYWFRLLDSIRDDYPGLRAIVGADQFDKLATAYLNDCPSESFTLRDLGSHLEAWLAANPSYAGSRLTLALDMARLEWAHIVAFDGRLERALEPEDLAELTPNLRVGIQPYVSLLELEYPVDVMRVHLNSVPEDVATTSNIVIRRHVGRTGRLRLVKREHIFLAVHRIANSVYYRRLASEEYRLLLALRSGSTVARAIDKAFRRSTRPASEIAESIRIWFSTWAQFGWLTVRTQLKEDDNENVD